jgi:hypothetical protein
MLNEKQAVLENREELNKKERTNERAAEQNEREIILNWNRSRTERKRSRAQ